MSGERIAARPTAKALRVTTDKRVPPARAAASRSRRMRRKSEGQKVIVGGAHVETPRVKALAE